MLAPGSFYPGLELFDLLCPRRALASGLGWSAYVVGLLYVLVCCYVVMLRLWLRWVGYSVDALARWLLVGLCPASLLFASPSVRPIPQPKGMQTAYQVC